MRRVLLLLTPFVAGLLMCLLCARLGFWQLDRAAFKAARQAHLDAAGPPLSIKSADKLEAWQRVSLSGTWLATHTVFLDNRVNAKQTGYHVLTPLQLADNGGVVIVNRGWVAAGLRREVLPVVPTVQGVTKVSGMMLLPDLTSFRLDDGRESGLVWQRADPAHFAARLGASPSALVLFQESDGNDGLLHNWPRPDLGVTKHKAYALQWFVFSAIALGLTGFFAWRQLRQMRSRVSQ